VNVSVIIAVFNGADFIAEALDSVFAQTHPAASVIVVNDGSTDGTAAVLDRCAGRITVLTQSNQGLALSRNRALDAADGDLVAFLDADDVWEPTKLAEQVAYFIAHPECAVVHTGAWYINGNGDMTERAVRPGPRPEAWCYETLLRRNTIFLSSTAVRRSALAGQRFVTDAAGCEDWDLWLRLAKHHQFGYLDMPLTRYRIHGSNMSGKREAMCRMRIRVMDRVLEREVGWTARRLARQTRRHCYRELSQLCLDAGRMSEARGHVLRLGTFLRRGDLRRFWLSYVRATRT
jgi:glycosyltransferase involved in cell wall biosynthesis